MTFLCGLGVILGFFAAVGFYARWATSLDDYAPNSGAGYAGLISVLIMLSSCSYLEHHQ